MTMLEPFGWKNKGEPGAKKLNAANLEEERALVGQYVDLNFLPFTGGTLFGNLIIEADLRVDGQIEPSSSKNEGEGEFKFGGESWGGTGEVGEPTAITGIQYTGTNGNQLFTLSSANTSGLSLQTDGSIFAGDGTLYNPEEISVATDGGLVVQGGAAIGGNLHVQGSINIGGDEHGVEPARETEEIEITAPSVTSESTILITAEGTGTFTQLAVVLRKEHEGFVVKAWNLTESIIVNWSVQN